MAYDDSPPVGWLAAGAAAGSLVLYAAKTIASGALESCPVGIGEPCGASSGFAVGAYLLWIVYILATACYAGIAGGIAGNHRRPFSGGSIPATLVFVVVVPWAFGVYAVAYLVGRLIPRSGTLERREAHEKYALDAHAYARETYRHLTAGEPPVVLTPVDVALTEPVLLDVPFGCSVFLGPPDAYARTALTNVGSPLFVAGRVVADTFGSGVEYRPPSGPEADAWNRLGIARVLLAPTTTWAWLNGDWLVLPHASIARYDIFDGAVVLGITDGRAVRFDGPLTLAHAVLVTYLQSGRDGLAAHPLLKKTLAPLPVWADDPT